MVVLLQSLSHIILLQSLGHIILSWEMRYLPAHFKMCMQKQSKNITIQFWHQSFLLVVLFLLRPHFPSLAKINEPFSSGGPRISLRQYVTSAEVSKETLNKIGPLTQCLSRDIPVGFPQNKILQIRVTLLVRVGRQKSVWSLQGTKHVYTVRKRMMLLVPSDRIDVFLPTESVSSLSATEEEQNQSDIQGDVRKRTLLQCSQDLFRRVPQLGKVTL